MRNRAERGCWLRSHSYASTSRTLSRQARRAGSTLASIEITTTIAGQRRRPIRKTRLARAVLVEQGVHPDREGDDALDEDELPADIRSERVALA
jgi:hypothetical protein